MSLVSRADLSRLVRVSKPAITKAIEAGHLVVNADGKIDTESPANAAYIARRQEAEIKAAVILPSPGRHPRVAAPKPVAKKPEPHIARGPPPGSSEACGATVAPPPPDPPPTPSSAKPKTSRGDEAARALEGAIAGLSLDTDKKRAQIQLMHAQRDRHQIAIAEKKHELVPRDLVRRQWSAFDAALKSNLRDLPRRSAARLHAIATSEGAQGLERALEDEISQALARVVREAKGQGLAD